MAISRATPPGPNPDCFDCGGWGQCDVCDNPRSSAEDIARDLSRNGLLKPATCERVRQIIARHLDANSTLAADSPTEEG